MSRTILLADDSLTIQKVVELTFADTDYEVVAVSSGDDLLERLPTSDANLVICDVIMPGRDGYDVCHEIKSNPDTLHLPVILLTGTFEPFDRDRALAVGCSEIITKPFEARKLVEAVNRLATDEGGAPPAAASVDREDRIEVEGQVTPPPPIVIPEDLSPFEDELQDTAVSAEYGPGPEEATQGDDPSTDLPAAPVAESPNRDTVDFAAPEENVEFDLVEEAETTEIEPTFEMPTAEPIADIVDADFDHDASVTVADLNVAESSQSPLDEPFSDQPMKLNEDVFPSDESGGDPFPTPEPTTAAQPPSQFETDFTKTTPINVGEVMTEDPVHDEISDFEFDAATDEVPNAVTQEIDDISDADTQDFDDSPATIDEPAEEIPTAAVQAISDTPPPDVDNEPAPSRLSDEDIDRIARRVIELSSDRIEHIAWDVIPDMAEIVVRARIQEIEDEAGKEPN